MMASQGSNREYARCIDCRFFGQHGAFCDLMDKQIICATEACVFFQWKQEYVLRHMDPVYFWPCFDAYRTEMQLRGMDVRWRVRD